MLRRAVTAAEANVHPLVSWCRTITTDTKVGGGGTLGGCSITLYVYELYSSSGYHTHTHVGSNVGETAKEFELRLKELQVLKASAPIVELPDAEYPSWLWTINQPTLTFTQMQELGLEKLSTKQRARFFKLQRRLHVKQKNVAASR
uniref:54S ribosomal protein L37, mitochondrial n=1 Tax=Lygus hesperus TaxID=30085 RepID=A0A0A9X2R6_LYGHE